MVTVGLVSSYLVGSIQRIPPRLQARRESLVTRCITAYLV